MIVFLRLVLPPKGWIALGNILTPTTQPVPCVASMKALAKAIGSVVECVWSVGADCPKMWR